MHPRKFKFDQIENGRPLVIIPMTFPMSGEARQIAKCWFAERDML